jgi:hypothetical protein
LRPGNDLSAIDPVGKVVRECIADSIDDTDQPLRDAGGRF